VTVGEIVTLDPTGAVGAEKAKTRPAVVLHVFGATVLVVPVTDARKSRLPTHYLLRGYDSGTQAKDALVTCEHLMCVAPARLSRRAAAAVLTPADLAEVKHRVRLAVALEQVPTPPPGSPKLKRGSFVSVDFLRGVPPEPTGVAWSLILSNDTGNYFGRHYIVAPVVVEPVMGVSVTPLPVGAAGAVDLGRMRVVDHDRLAAGGQSLAAAQVDMNEVDAALRTVLK
jgi:mRNA-degrading endonuclease toxin of MazEF toxin-antitoxin module